MDGNEKQSVKPIDRFPDDWREILNRINLTTSANGDVHDSDGVYICNLNRLSRD